MDIENIIATLSTRMDKTLAAFNHDVSGVRTGRASTSLLDPLKVNAYGALVPVNQIGSVSTPDAKTISIQVWDGGMVNAVMKAINDSELGLNPTNDGTLIRITLPDLSAQRRQELVKVVHKYAEQSKVSVRNVRRDGMDAVKAAEKNSDISEDEKKHYCDDIQKLTDKYIEKVDAAAKKKEADITSV